MRLYFKYISILLKSQMQYKTSFILLSLGQFFVPFLNFLGIYFLFERFGQIKGWSFYEAALCFAVIHISFSISECFARGFDAFSRLIIDGSFDRLLVRPRNIFLQVLGSRFEFSRIGRLIQSAVVFIWAVFNLSVSWNIYKAVTLIFMVVCGIFIFTGIFVLSATLSFWTIQGLELANIFTDGGREISQYPLSIYKKWVTQFFTFIIPFGCINYIPLMYILNKGDYSNNLYMLMPLAGIVFIVPCILIWLFGVKHYKSTGS